jgi:BirA family biotin operon repressor/biotin-[acetyl-CoA-carboxylase] ligase
MQETADPRWHGKEEQEAGCMGKGELTAEAIARARRTARLGRPVIYFGRVGSTNDVALQQGATGAAEGLLVVADEQTAGRGRMGRSWVAPRGTSLLFSLLLRPAIPSSQAGKLMMCLGLGAVEGIEIVTGLRPALKWPNDLLLEGRKLGGMLAEMRTAGDRVEYAVLGLGLNVNIELEGQAWMSLSTVLGRRTDRVELLAEILARCEAWYDRLADSTATPGDDQRTSGEQIHAAWAARLDTLGRYVTVSTPSGEFRGRATGVTSEGALILEAEIGEPRVVWSGDVSILQDPHPARTA